MKRVLYLAYYFPPAGGPGVQRSLKFVRYLPDAGWLPTVVSVDPAHAAWPAHDASMVAEIPVDVEVHRTRSWDPYSAYARLRGRSKAQSVGVGFADDQAPGIRERVARIVRANLFLPDARVGWNRHARRAVTGLVAKHDFDAILTSGPPHSTHLVGQWAAKRFRLPWLADFRDPWGELSYYDQLPFTNVARWVDGRFERRVLREASDVVTVSPAVAQLLEGKRGRPVTTIPNGFDPSDFDGIEPTTGEGFRIVYVGTLTAAQNPTGVWSAVRSRRAQGQDIRLQLVGRIDAAVRASLREEGLLEVTQETPYVPHRQAISFMKGADLLLLSLPRTRDEKGILTGKIFEYLASGSPILGVGAPDSDVGELIRKCGSGQMFAHENVSDIAGFVDEQFTRPDTRTEPDQGYLDTYARPNLAAKLAGRLNAISAT